MILKVAIPGKMQFKMIRREPSFLLSGQGDIHYIGGAEVLPPPLESEKENEILSTEEISLLTKLQKKLFSQLKMVAAIQ